MIEKIIDYMQPIVVEYGALGVFFATLLEEIVAPIPSPLVSLMAGFFLLSSDEKALIEIVWQALFIIALPVAFGITIGSIVIYSIGYIGGKPAIERNKKWLGLKWDDLKKMESKLTRGSGDEIMLFALRFMPIVPSAVISGFCGIIRYPIKNFAVVTFFGSFSRAILLGIVGWYVGDAYADYSEIISKIEKYIFVILVVLVMFFLVRFYVKRKNNGNVNPVRGHDRITH